MLPHAWIPTVVWEQNSHVRWSCSGGVGGTSGHSLYWACAVREAHSCGKMSFSAQFTESCKHSFSREALEPTLYPISAEFTGKAENHVTIFSPPAVSTDWLPRNVSSDSDPGTSGRQCCSGPSPKPVAGSRLRDWPSALGICTGLPHQNHLCLSSFCFCLAGSSARPMDGIILFCISTILSGGVCQLHLSTSASSCLMFTLVLS